MVLLSTCNIKMKGILGKLQRRFVGPFRVTETIGWQAYRLYLPDTWKIHLVFHVSLLKDWNTVDLQEDQPISQEDVPEAEEPYYEIERILHWRKIKKGNKILKEYLVCGRSTQWRMRCGYRPINLATPISYKNSLTFSSWGWSSLRIPAAD